MIAGLRQQYRLVDLLLIAKMARSVYYYHLKCDGELDPHQKVKGRITQIFNTHQCRYGYQRVYL